jgi:Putative rhamnosyl transferase
MFHHYIITRFSVLDTKTNKFRLTRKRSNSNIKKSLFNTTRLDNKFALFDKMTYPSVKNQSYKHFTWLIYASPQLPAAYKLKLKKYESPHIKIIYVNNFKEMDADIEAQIKKDSFTTIRLDDDDGLNPEYLEMLNKYESEKGAIISAPHGRWYRLRDGEVQMRKRINQKNLALGLAAIGFNIYKAGNHMKVHEKHRVIYDNMPDAFVRSCSEMSNTQQVC